MKKLKRIFSLMIAVVMMMAMSVTAFADDTYSITVNNTNSSVSINGKEYFAYKIFNATKDDTTGEIEYSYDDNDNTLLRVEYKVGGETLSGNSLLTWLSKQEDNGTSIREFADYVYETYIDKGSVEPSGTGTASNETAIINLTTPGYYLVYGEAEATDGLEGKEKVVAAVSLTTANPTETINPKVDAPELKKEIQHNDDNSWGFVGDNQIGDTVNFRTITTVPDTNGYDTYEYYICDKMGEQFDFNEDVEIYVEDKDKGGTLLDDDYYNVTYENAVDNDGNELTFRVDVDILDALANGKITSESQLYTYYSGVLNEKAKLYTVGPQENEAYLQYSNNPYDGGVGETVHDKVYDWTFIMEVNKVDQAGDSLEGAEFVLTTDEDLRPEYNAEGNLTNAEDFIQFIKNGSTYRVAKAGYTPTSSETFSYIISGSTANLEGLDDHITYYLHETKAPDGYNKLDAPVEFTISANSAYSNNGSTINKEKLTVTVGTEEPSNNLSTDVENKYGATLPSTGGIGTRIFYAVGAVLMIGAAVIFFTRKRVEK